MLLAVLSPLSCPFSHRNVLKTCLQVVKKKRRHETDAGGEEPLDSDSSEEEDDDARAEAEAMAEMEAELETEYD